MVWSETIKNQTKLLKPTICKPNRVILVTKVAQFNEWSEFWMITFQWRFEQRTSLGFQMVHFRQARTPDNRTIRKLDTFYS
jgi:hypothetical protein